LLVEGSSQQVSGSKAQELAGSSIFNQASSR